MNELAKWFWIAILCVLYFGWWLFVILGIYLVCLGLVRLFKPDWLKHF